MPKQTNTETIWTSGRRKTAVARIKLTSGKGEVLINDTLGLGDYFPSAPDQEKFFEPFVAVGQSQKGFTISIKLAGGGKKAQLVAAQLAISKALMKLDPNLRELLKKKRLLTRDPRMKERKKYGLKKARKAPQFSKR